MNTLTRRALVRRSCTDVTLALRRLGAHHTVFALPRFSGRVWAEPDGALTSWLCLDGVYPVAGYRTALARATQLLAQLARAIERTAVLPP